MNNYKFLVSSSLDDLVQSITNLDFAIPPEIFSAVSSLTNFVGYIMPLYLYMPIITLILSYWFLMIAVNAGKSLISFFGEFSSFLAKIYK